MYLPSYLKKQLTTPEALRFEQTRRALKDAVSAAARALRDYRQPARHPHTLTPKEQRDWAIYLRSVDGLAVRNGEAARPLLDMPQIIQSKDIAIERQRRYDLTLAYQAALIAHPAKRAALVQAEADARQAYADHINQASDLE